MDGGGGGPGDGFDPCECICTYDGAMRRLISLVSHYIPILTILSIDKGLFYEFQSESALITCVTKPMFTVQVKGLLSLFLTFTSIKFLFSFSFEVHRATAQIINVYKSVSSPF